MFSWFKKKPSPPAPAPKHQPPTSAGTPPSNPSLDELPHQFRWGTREENVDLVDVLARLLADKGHELERADNAIVLHPSGLRILPVLGDLQPNDDGSVRTMTITRVRHPSFGGAEVFEFQHAASATAEKSVRQGFDQWIQVDLVALLDALRDKPAVCMIMDMEFPEKDGAPARTRRVVLSPVAYFAQRPLPTPAANAEGTCETEPQHGSFCPCCLFTNTFDAFKSQIESDGFHALRLYASRDPEGQSTADCRINGLDYDPGKLALCKYVERWPDQGVEFRKQYVIIQSPPAKVEK
jgi:hypothetical protein